VCDIVVAEQALATLKETGRFDAALHARAVRRGNDAGNAETCPRDRHGAVAADTKTEEGKEVAVIPDLDSAHHRAKVAFEVLPRG
jgi:hypothetical protein